MNQNKLFDDLNTPLPKDIAQAKAFGDYQLAKKLIQQRLDQDFLPQSLRNSLILQKEILNRKEKIYCYDFDQALKLVQKEVPEFTTHEFQYCLNERCFGWIYLNGKVHVVHSFLDSLKKYEFFRKRLKDYKPIKIEDTGYYKTIQKMKQKGAMAHRITIRHSIQLKDEFFTPGMKVLVHLPIPCACDSQKEIRILEHSNHAFIDKEDALQRTICFEETMTENHPFMVEYSYINHVDYVKLDRPGIDNHPAFDIDEQPPHITFTPYIRKLCAELSKDISDPLLKAKAFYDFITRNMKYAYQEDYFVMDHIPETCGSTYRGDCGIFALTFITLCRCAGIPAKWQSSLYIDEDGVGSHDWARFYVAPYGWLYADPSFGVGANRNQYEEGREYYFGNLDSYRMVANNAFEAEFEKEKHFFRMDPYDNQRGEMECEDKGFEDEHLIIKRELISIEEL